MSDLINLNESQVPSICSNKGFVSSSQESSTGISLKSPIMFTNMSEHTECLRLTPVNIKNLTSPLRVANEELHDYGEEATAYTAYKENFNLISRKLEKLLNELNIIYKEIGYSNTEISSKEKQIFNSLSDSITGFFEKANEERERISSENETSQEVLQRILQVIRDPKGTNTIPDLYTRNVIVSNESAMGAGINSPKKHTSLLSKRKILSKAKNYVLKTYSPMLVKFLEGSIRLKGLIAAVSDFKPLELEWNVEHILSIIPPLETCKLYKSYLQSNENEIDKISEFITENKQVLLHTINFNDISDLILHRIEKLASMYEQEYEKRIRNIQKVSVKILGLLKLLDVDTDRELDKDVMTTLRVCSELSGLEKTELNASLTTLRQLERIYSDYRVIEENRKSEKNHLHQRCSQLWEKLKIPQAYVEKFETRNNDLSLVVLKRYADELKRLQEMKKKLIKNLIEDCWMKIQELWSEMHFSDRDTHHFKELYKTINSGSTTLEDDEKVLETCEAEIMDLEKKYALYKPILKLIEEFKSLQNDKTELERSSRDSSRLLLRNSHKILLQEEKTRKRITRHFPSIIHELTRKLKDFERDFGEPLIIDGVKFLDVVLEQEADIISKYPRSRINSFRGTNSLKVTKPKSPHKERIHQKPTIKPKSIIQRTPLRITESANVLGSKPLDSCGLSKTSTEMKPSFNRYMHATRISSPSKDINEAHFSLVMTRSSPTRIPKLSGLPSFRSSNTFPPPPRSRLVRPALLSQISPNKLNTMVSPNKLNRMVSPKKQNTGEQPPMDMYQNGKRSALHGLDRSIDDLNKENTIALALKSPAKISVKKLEPIESPIREQDDHVYKITKSPEGKYLLNIHSAAQDEGDGESEDTSMMEDDRFVTWKKERFAKMNKCSSNDQEIPSSINWDTDVF